MSKPAKQGGTGKKKEQEPKITAKKRVARPKTPPPPATVETRHDGKIITRQAGGYSQGELLQAGLNASQARGWGVPVDGRRRSVLDANVASLKKWAPKAEKGAEARMEGEVKKIEKEVEKEARRVEKEARKVEEEVVEKVEAPVKKRVRKAAGKAKPSDQ